MFSLGELLRLSVCRGLRPNPTCPNIGDRRRTVHAPRAFGSIVRAGGAWVCREPSEVGRSRDDSSLHSPHGQGRATDATTGHRVGGSEVTWLLGVSESQGRSAATDGKGGCRWRSSQ